MINRNPHRRLSRLWRELKWLRRLLRSWSGVTGLILIGFFVFVALRGQYGKTPFPVTEQDRLSRLSEPDDIHRLGTDLLGRDIESRLIRGATNSLYVAFLSVAFAGVVGTLIGMTSGYVGGIPDNVMMRLMDVLLAFPAILLALIITTVLNGQREFVLFADQRHSTVLAIGVVYTPIFARVARAPVLSVKEMEFVMAARSVGMRGHRILFRHIFPNTLAPIIVQFSLSLSWALLTEAGLSYLGLGIQQPEPSWGVMLDDGQGLYEIAPWLMIYPAVAIMLSVLGFNLLGDGLRDALDPRLKSS